MHHPELIDELRPLLDGIKRRHMATMPRDAMATLLDSTEQLVRSGIAEKALPEGAVAPDFGLPDYDGNTVQLAGLLEKGPVVVSFFRGFW